MSIAPGVSITVKHCPVPRKFPDTIEIVSVFDSRVWPVAKMVDPPNNLFPRVDFPDPSLEIRKRLG